jgi:CRP-like cAMP-binding protein
MMYSFIDYFDQCIPGSETVMAAISPYIQTMDLARNGFLLEAGNICHKLSYITQGACIKYRIKDGKEEVIDFYLEGMLTGDYVSFVTMGPTDQYVKALEDTRLEQITREDLLHLYSTQPLMERAGRIISERIYCRAITRMLSYQNESPELRYRNLVTERPTLFQRVPQYLIASYLGVTAVGLSKIRKRLRDLPAMPPFIKQV